MSFFTKHQPTTRSAYSCLFSNMRQAMDFKSDLRCVHKERKAESINQ